jgi:hypothetical protein
MIAVSILQGRCRHVRRVMMMVMAMSQLGHCELTLANLGRDCQSEKQSAASTQHSAAKARSADPVIGGSGDHLPNYQITQLRNLLCLESTDASIP